MFGCILIQSTFAVAGLKRVTNTFRFYHYNNILTYVYVIVFLMGQFNIYYTLNILSVVPVVKGRERTVVIVMH